MVQTAMSHHYVIILILFMARTNLGRGANEIWHKPASSYLTVTVHSVNYLGLTCAVD